MVTLADRFAAHQYLADYSASVDSAGVAKLEPNVVNRIRALEILIEDAEELPPQSIIEQKLADAAQAGQDEIDDGDSATGAGLMGVLGRAIYKFGKRLVSFAGRWAWKGAKFVGRTAVRFLVRGILMPVAGVVVSTIGLPATIILGLAGAITYILYDSWFKGDSVDFKGIDVSSLKPKERTAVDTHTQTSRAPATRLQRFNGSSIDDSDIEPRVGQSSAAPTPKGNNVQAFIQSIDPNLIAIGKANSFVSDSGVDLAGMNPDFMTIFYAMVGDFVKQGGTKVRINSAHRDIAKQKRLYDAWIARGRTGGAVAKPGRSRHQRGLALDIASISANAMHSMGLLNKYKFIRPVRGEAWHLENLLFGSGAATQKAVAEAKAESDKVMSERQTIKEKPVEVSPDWLAKYKESPDSIAAVDHPIDAKVNSQTYYENGKPLTYRQIYEKTQTRQTQNDAVDSKGKEVVVPKPQPQQQAAQSSGSYATMPLAQDKGQQQWVKIGGKLVSST